MMRAWHGVGLTALLMVGGVAGNAAAVAIPEDDRFVGMYELLRGVRSIAMEATIEMRIHQADVLREDCLDPMDARRDRADEDTPQIVRGSMSYVARGEAYRYTVDLPAYPLSPLRTEVAYDGEAYTYIDHQGRIVGQTRGGDHGLQGLIMALPIFAGYEIIEPQHDGKPTIPHLPSLRAMIERGQLPSFDRWLPAEVDGLELLASRASYDDGVFPGGHELHVFVHPEEPDRPARIEIRDLWPSVPILISEIRHYAPIEHGDGSTSEWPLFVSYTAYCSEGRRVFDLSFVVRSLLINDERIEAMSMTPTIPSGYVHAADGEFVVDGPAARAARHAEHWDAIQAALEAGDDAAVVEVFMRIAESREPRDMLIVSQSEAEFVAGLLGRTPAEQEPLYQALMEAASEIRQAARIVIARGDALRDAGDRDGARAHYEAVRRIGVSHTDDQAVLLMQAVGRALRDGAALRIERLDEPAPDMP